MITITIDGKTYTPCPSLACKHCVTNLIHDMMIKGFLEEVKENKEIDMDKQNSWLPFEIRHQSSILEKLREFISKDREWAMTKGYVDEDYINALDKVSGFLTSLEQPYNGAQGGNSVSFYGEQPQFTPGQMIEVSNDGEKWEKREFLKIQGFLIPFSDEIDRKYCTVEYSGAVNTWKYARQPQEDIELPAFDWDWVMKQLEENQKLNLIPFTALAVMATHIVAMDKLIKANKK